MHAPTAHAARPTESSEPATSSHFRSKLRKLRKQPVFRVERVIQERRVRRRRPLDFERVVAQLFEQHGQHQRASVVVQAVAFVKIGNGDTSRAE